MVAFFAFAIRTFIRYNDVKGSAVVALIPNEAITYFENGIYLPLLITILERDRESIVSGPFKLRSPYLTIIDGALRIIHADLFATNTYMKRNNMKLFRGDNDGAFTEFTFIYDGYEDRRRYLNVRLRNRSEELLGVYFAKASRANA